MPTTSMVVTASQAISVLRNVSFLASLGQRALARMRPPEARIFDVPWWFYDHDPEISGLGDHTGEARLLRVGRGDMVTMQSVRVRERTDPKIEVIRPYVASGRLRGNKIVLSWEAVGRPTMFGSMLLSIGIDCDRMTGVTIYGPPDTNEITQFPIWFRRAPSPV